ncbi:MAG: regulatory iron-sulfur-containing complex subunit RicT [Candidatus Latescibacterota bacterium]
MALVEIAFKNPRRDFYRNTNSIDVSPGDYCIVQAERGEDMGQVIRFNDHHKPKRNVRIRTILRVACEEDVERLEDLRNKETGAFEVCKQKVELHGLPMKVVDVEYQFDGNKITFYFTSEQRVDFRQLVKDLAASFKTRIELRQIGARDEAKRFPGYGVCGKKTCCTSWLWEFEPVSLRMAKEQNLPLTPSKLTGVCGRLMCCLSYELGNYRFKTEGLPCIGDKINCFGQKAKVEKIDIFKEEVNLITKDGQAFSVGFEEMKRELKKSSADVVRNPEKQKNPSGDPPNEEDQ